MAVDLDAKRGLMILFLTLHIVGGHVGMLLILSAIFVSSRVMRHPVFINFCITWIVYSGSYTLLFYGGQIEELFPNYSLCVTQASMIYGSVAMVGVSSFIFLLHVYFVIRGALYPNPPLRWHKLRLGIMLSAPYIVHLIVFTIAIASGSIHPELVHRSSFYCTIKIPAVANLGAGVAVISAVSAIVVQTLKFILLSRHWREIRKSGTSLSYPVRTGIFAVAGFFGILSAIAFILDSHSEVPNILVACFPMVFFLVFGTQSDLLRAWCFWRKPSDRKIGPASGPKYGEDV